MDRQIAFDAIRWRAANEFAMMSLALGVGVDVPETRLGPNDQIDGLPDDVARPVIQDTQIFSRHPPASQRNSAVRRGGTEGEVWTAQR